MRWRFSRFFAKLFLLHVLLVGSVLAISLYPISRQLRGIVLDDVAAHLRAQAAAFQVAYRSLRLQDQGILQQVAREWVAGQKQPLRLTIITADGTVLADSEGEPASMELHANRPEVQQALREGWGESTRWSHTVARELRYLAVRVDFADSTPIVIRVAIPVEAIDARLLAPRRFLVTVIVGALFAVPTLALGLALLWNRRIAALTRTAHDLARGDHSARVRVSGKDEVAALSRSVHRMADRLARQLEAEERHRRMLELLLGQLREGVVVADSGGRIVLANAQARRLLQMNVPGCDETLIGCSIERCIHSRELQDLLRGVGATGEGMTGRNSGMDATAARELRLHVGPGAEPVTVHARVFDIAIPAAIRGAALTTNPSAPGRVLLVSDVSEFTRVVQVKADFAANASHELRTPLSAIRAAVDTLKSVDWRGEPESVQRFVEVIARHGNRMEAMVADLLELSRLESPAATFQPETLDPSELLEELRVAFASGLSSKKLHWESKLPPPGRPVIANPHLLRAVLRNLVENAVQFTEVGGHIRITVHPQSDAMVFVVEDDGCGIPREEQSRVFERFYQVQRARSGADRGTGLGLSIVRHAVAAMQGTVSLESEPGRGTRVTVTVPQPVQPARTTAMRGADTRSNPQFPGAN